MKKGFSMVELLTVVLIAMILVGITLPVFFQAKSRAKQTICLSNLRQIYLGIELYEQEYGILPGLSNEHPDWYMNFTGGVLLKCPQAKAGLNYLIHAGPPPDFQSNASSKHWGDLIADCMDKRGSRYPYASDTNHLGAREVYQGGGERVIVVRADGSAASVPFNNRVQTWPCSPELGAFPQQ